jgi:quercetin dioxygenase-like cupin family protein
MIRAASYFFAIVVGSHLASAATAQDVNVTPLFKTELKDMKDREGAMSVIELAPGASSNAHRHNAHVFVYVLEGSIVMQVEGGEPTVLNAGQTFYENPDDIHTVSKNASETEPAKFLALLIKPKGTPATVPVH